MLFVPTRIDLENILIELSQKEKINTACSHLYVESKIQHKSTYLWNKTRFTDTENRLVVAKVEEGTIGGMEREFRISQCKPTYRMDKQKILLCSTGNYIQYPVPNYNGKEYEKEYVYV